MLVGRKAHRMGTAARGAASVLLCFVLAFGMLPVSSSDYASPENVSQGENANQNSSSGESDSSNANSNSSKSNNSNSEKSSGKSSDSSSQASSEGESQKDPYEYSYEASAADAGSSAGSITWITADTAQGAAVAQARETYSASDVAVLVSCKGGAELLCAAALAGANAAPLLFVDEQGQLDEATATLMHDLGVTKVYAVGFSESSSVDRLANTKVVRLNGTTSAETSLAVLRQGVEDGLWKPVAVTLANGADVTVANGAAALAYDQAQPVLLTDAEGALTSSEKMFLSQKSTKLSCLANVQVIAKDGRVQQQTVDAISLFCCENKGCSNVKAVEGSDECAVAQNASSLIKGGVLDAANGVVTNIEQTSAATAGIMALRQGRAAISTWGGSLSSWARTWVNTNELSLTLSGEGGVVDSGVLSNMRAALGIYSVEQYEAGVSIVDMAKKEVERYIEDGKATRSMDEVLESLDPGLASRGTEYYYQFAQVGDGYSGAVTAEQIDGFIASVAGTYEASYGCTSVLRGTGQAFIEAAQESGVNEVYLLAHAILESGCGCSSLARGNAGGMNMFGIAAYDSDPNNGGSYALSQGWDSAEAAIKGGAAWIASNYIHSGYGQDTLYQMRWNVSAGSHQYASSLTWAKSIAKLMSRFYEYAGIGLEHTGLNFKVISY